MRYPTREYQRDSPSDLLLRRPQGIKPKKKLVKIRGYGLTRKVISAPRQRRLLTPLYSGDDRVHLIFKWTLSQMTEPTVPHHRATYSMPFKLDLVQRSLKPGACVVQLARASAIRSVNFAFHLWGTSPDIYTVIVIALMGIIFTIISFNEIMIKIRYTVVIGHPFN